MIVALFPNFGKALAEETAREIAQFLGSRGVIVAIETQTHKVPGTLPLAEVSSEKIDFCISIGGDGTILRLVHQYPNIQAPILAINLGSLGFMADIPIHAVYSSLENLLSGNYSVQSRIVMDGESVGVECFAVNDIVIHRANNPCLIDLAIYIDDQYLNTFSADGVILSTPSGSTAYSLAAGGPILTPELNAFVLTPICPHTISNKPIVLLPKRELRVEYISTHQPLEVTYDGLFSVFISTGESVLIRRSERHFRLVTMPDHDYFATLRTKLDWKGKLR